MARPQRLVRQTGTTTSAPKAKVSGAAKKSKVGAEPPAKKMRVGPQPKPAAQSKPRAAKSAVGPSTKSAFGPATKPASRAKAAPPKPRQARATAAASKATAPRRPGRSESPPASGGVKQTAGDKAASAAVRARVMYNRVENQRRQAQGPSAKPTRNAKAGGGAGSRPRAGG